MGWSCRAEAGNTLNAWQDACFAQTGMANVFLSKGGSERNQFAGGSKYMFEVSNKEHHDGAITGSIQRFVDDTHVVKAGSFRIEPDGTVSRAPAFLKAIKGKLLTRNGIGSGGPI